jgi:hypothetical protein
MFQYGSFSDIIPAVNEFQPAEYISYAKTRWFQKQTQQYSVPVFIKLSALRPLLHRLSAFNWSSTLKNVTYDENGDISSRPLRFRSTFLETGTAEYSLTPLRVVAFKKKYKGGGTHRLTAYAAAAQIIIG